MPELTAAEQYMLELTNNYRVANGLQPVATDPALAQAADTHNANLLASDQFVHSNPVQDANDAGFQWRAGSYGMYQNHQWNYDPAVDPNTTAGLQADVLRHFQGYQSSPTHNENMLNPNHEISGMGVAVGEFAGYNPSVVSTQDFGWNERSAFLLGTAYNDTDADRTYDMGEGIAGIRVDVTDAAGVHHLTTTGTAGGYQLELGAGIYRVEFENSSGAIYDTRTVTLGEFNVDLDEVNPVLPPASKPGVTLVGDKRANTLTGTAGDDHLSGGAGNDKLYGLAGNDVLTGGADDDRFYFSLGFGQDTITDFVAGSSRIDGIDLTGLGRSFTDVMAHAAQSGTSTVFQFGSDKLTVEHTTVSQFVPSDFILHA